MGHPVPLRQSGGESLGLSKLESQEGGVVAGAPRMRAGAVVIEGSVLRTERRFGRSKCARGGGGRRRRGASLFLPNLGLSKFMHQAGRTVVCAFRIRAEVVVSERSTFRSGRRIGRAL